MPSECERSTPTCIVAGAGPGLGLSVAERFAREGFSVYLLSQRPLLLAAGIDRLHNHGLRIEAIRCDIADPDVLDNEVRSIEISSGSCDVFVYNAFVESDGGRNIERLAVPLRTIVRMMHAKGGGAIVFSTHEDSEAARLRAFARDLAKEEEASGVRVGIVTIDGAVPTSRTKLTSIAAVYWKLFYAADSIFESEPRVGPGLLEPP